MKTYKYDCFVTKMMKFGLLDSTNELRCTSYKIDGVIQRRTELGWGKVIRIKVTDKGIAYGEVVE